MGMITIVEQHAAFFLLLFGIIWTALLLLGGFVVRMEQRRFTELEKGQERQDDAIASLRSEFGEYKVKADDMKAVLAAIEHKAETLGDKLSELAKENIESHGVIIEGRANLLQRVTALEAKANGKMDRLEALVVEMLSRLRGRE